MADQQVVPGVRVPLIDEDAATGRTAELYDLVKQATGLPVRAGHVPARLDPSGPARALIGGFGGAFGGGVLTRETKEIISAWTSKLNSCPYCVGTHNYFLRMFGGTEELVEAIKTATSSDDLPVDDRTKQLLRLVTKVTQAAYKITDDDWDAAERAGWTNAELLEAVFVAALFSFINRFVDSLGLGTSVEESRISSQPTG